MPALPTCPDWRSRSKLATGHRAAAPSWWDPHRPLRPFPLNNGDKTTTGELLWILNDITPGNTHRADMLYQGTAFRNVNGQRHAPCHRPWPSAISGVK